VLCRDFQGEKKTGVILFLVVGDHPSDAEFGHTVGAKAIYVLTGHGVKHRAELRVPASVVADIAAAAELIRESNGSAFVDREWHAHLEPVVCEQSGMGGANDRARARLFQSAFAPTGAAVLVDWMLG